VFFMMPLTSLLYAAAILLALLLPEYELRLFDGSLLASQRAALVDVAIGNKEAAAAQACGCLPGFITIPGEDDDFEEP
jgi:hypothetical protein